jgi:hypothetical protein
VLDLQNGVFEEKGLKMLEDWEKSSSSFLLGGDKQILLESSQQTFSMPNEMQNNSKSYDKLFQ